jgi:hypothetical protein
MYVWFWPTLHICELSPVCSHALIFTSARSHTHTLSAFHLCVFSRMLCSLLPLACCFNALTCEIFGFYHYAFESTRSITCAHCWCQPLCVRNYTLCRLCKLLVSTSVRSKLHTLSPLQIVGVNLCAFETTRSVTLANCWCQPLCVRIYTLSPARILGVNLCAFETTRSVTLANCWCPPLCVQSHVLFHRCALLASTSVRLNTHVLQHMQMRLHSCLTTWHLSPLGG